MTVNSRVSVTVTSTATNPLDLATGTIPLSLLADLVLPNGTGSGQADRIWHDQRTIAASGTDSLDLQGSLVDAFGAAFTPAKLKAIYVKAASGNTNNVVVTRPASNGVPVFSAAGDAVPVLPGGVFVWVAPGAGVTVTASTGDLLDLVNSSSGTSVTYDIVLIGTSA